MSNEILILEIADISRKIEEIKLPEGYPGSFIGAISALREASRDIGKVTGDAARWEKAQADNLERTKLAKQHAEEQKREREISRLWRLEMDKWRDSNLSAIEHAKSTGDWSNVPPEPKRSDIQL